MRNENRKRSCVAIIGTMTQTMRAQSVLQAALIRTRLIKADASKSGGGCAYALSYPCELGDRLNMILYREGILPISFYDEAAP